MEFPKVFDSCPLCHSTERVITAVVEREKAAGKIAQERVPASQQKLLAIMDPANPGFAFPALRIYYDYCGNCGFEYPHTVVEERMTYDQYQENVMKQLGLPAQYTRGQG